MMESLGQLARIGSEVDITSVKQDPRWHQIVGKLLNGMGEFQPLNCPDSKIIKFQYLRN